MKKFTVLIAAGLGAVGIVAAVLAFALQKNSAAIPAASQQKPQILASFYPLYFFATEIAGDDADVYNVTPAGAEPHDYEPTARDSARMERADLLIIHGMLEPWAERVKTNLAQTRVPILSASDGLLSGDVVTEEGDRIADPHVWLSPRLAAALAGRIADAIVRMDPDHEFAYRARAEALRNRLSALDAAYKTGLASCRERSLVTAHAAFGYLAKEYDLVQIPIAGLSPDAEPTPLALAGIARLMREKNIRSVFFERLVSPKLADTLAAEVGARTFALDPLEGLEPSALSEGKNYMTEMEQNLAHLRIALQCQ